MPARVVLNQKGLQMTIRIADVESESIVDGPGFRFAVYTQGCPHACPGCHNPQTHPFEGGREVEPADLLRLAQESPLNKGVTLSGGEPFCQAEALVPFARLAREAGYSVWAYSGYTYDALTGDAAPAGAAELLALCDVLVDGPYVKALGSYEAKWRGSTNQRVIDLARTRAAGKVVLYEEDPILAAFTRPRS